MNELSRAAKDKRSEYQRAWSKKNADKRKKYMKDYWERKAATELNKGV